MSTSQNEWRHTHNGEGNEELYMSKEGKYYTKFAWDHFLAAYTGKVRRVGRDRPPVADASNGWDSAWSPSVAKGVIDFYSNGTDLWPADETTDPMPQPVIRPRQLTPVAPLKKLDPTGKFGYSIEADGSLAVENQSTMRICMLEPALLDRYIRASHANNLVRAAHYIRLAADRISRTGTKADVIDAADILNMWANMADTRNRP